MIECLIIGDSIAVGIQQNRNECPLYATIGITSQNWMKKYNSIEITAKSVIISLGTNDYNSATTRDSLIKLRAKIKASSVIWILPPIKPDIQSIVKNIAAVQGDQVLTIQNLSNDNVHPTGAEYKSLAKQTKILSW
jgi:lysophospholipase L1-like esterase